MDNESHSSFPYSREKTKKLTTAAMTTYKKPIRTVILAARAENDSDTEPLRKPPLGKQHLEESNDPEIWWTNCFPWCQAHPAPPGYVWTPVKTGINYPWNRAGVQPSTINQARGIPMYTHQVSLLSRWYNLWKHIHIQVSKTRSTSQPSSSEQLDVSSNDSFICVVFEKNKKSF